MFYGYCRVSTETQAEHGGGLEVQRQQIEKYAADNSLTIARFYTDAGISGAVKDTDEDEAISKRPALIEMLSSVGSGDTIIVLNTSRLWRSDTAKVIIRRELMKREARIISVENQSFDLYAQNPNDRFMNGIMELMDEWERLTIALKLSKGRTVKALSGNKPAGVCPFGYRYSADKKSVEIDTNEALLVKLMFSEAQKGQSLRQITETLTARGATTRQGNSWSKGSVQVVLRNRFYVGELTHAGKTIQGNHTPIISKVQFGKVAAQLDRRHR